MVLSFSMENRVKILAAVLMALLMSWALAYSEPVSPAAPGMVSERIEKPVRQSIDIRQETQRERARWLEEQQKMRQELERLETENSELSRRRDDLSSLVTETRARIAEKEQELKGLRQISEDMQPFLEDSFRWLEAEVSGGLPFLEKERSQRMARLRRLMDDPDVSLSEKFRKVMEALFVEAEYGITVEVNRESIMLSGEPVLVDVLRLGRLNLFYQTLDESGCGFYDSSSKTWEELPRKYGRNIKMALDMALKRRPVEFVRLPVGRLGVN